MRIKFLEGNSIDIYIRGTGEYLRFQPNEEKEVSDIAAKELLEVGRFEEVKGKSAESNEAGSVDKPKKKGKSKKEV